MLFTTLCFLNFFWTYPLYIYRLSSTYHLLRFIWSFLWLPLIYIYIYISGCNDRYRSGSWPPVHPFNWISQWPLQQQLWQKAAVHMAVVYGSSFGTFHHSPRWCPGSTTCLGRAHPSGGSACLLFLIVDLLNTICSICYIQAVVVTKLLRCLSFRLRVG